MKTKNYESTRNASLKEPEGCITLTIQYVDSSSIKKEEEVKSMNDRLAQQHSILSLAETEYPIQYDKEGQRKANNDQDDSDPADSDEESPALVKEQPSEKADPTAEPSFFRKMQSRVQAETAKVVTQMSISEERQTAWFTFYELLINWGENIGMAETIIAIKMLESYYERKRRPLGQDVTTKKQAENAAYYWKYAMAVFGWKGLAYCKKLVSCLRQNRTFSFSTQRPLFCAGKSRGLPARRYEVRGQVFGPSQGKRNQVSAPRQEGL